MGWAKLGVSPWHAGEGRGGCTFTSVLLGVVNAWVSFAMQGLHVGFEDAASFVLRTALIIDLCIRWACLLPTKCHFSEIAVTDPKIVKRYTPAHMFSLRQSQQV
jgi:hypothetical protein